MSKRHNLSHLFSAGKAQGGHDDGQLAPVAAENEVFIVDNQGNRQEKEEPVVSQFEKVIPQLTDQAHLVVGLVGEVSDEPSKSIHIRCHSGAGKNLADLRVVVLQKQPHEAEAHLQAHEIVVQELSWHHVLNEQLQAVEADAEAVLGHEEIVFLLLSVLTRSQVLVCEPHKRCQHFVDALLISNLCIFGIKSQYLFNVVLNLIVSLLSQSVDVSSFLILALPDHPDLLHP